MADQPIRELTDEEKAMIERINHMDHIEMARHWRFSTLTELFDSSKPYWSVFQDRFVNHFGGMTPEISKLIGWDH